MKQKTRSSYAKPLATSQARPATSRAWLARFTKLPPGVAILLMLAISAVLWLIIVRFGFMLWRMI